jgi:CHAT domain-containing protein/Tol biopolymer transport system component/Tfp pilus assembly protein PilF/TPR repeat protein
MKTQTRATKFNLKKAHGNKNRGRCFMHINPVNPIITIAAKYCANLRIMPLYILFFLVTIFGIPLSAFTQDEPHYTNHYEINRPLQITSRTEPVLDMAVSPDGQKIAYITGDNKPTTLWLASADPVKVLLPKRLISGNSAKSSPAISKDGRYVAYVDTDYDVNGDIYLIDLKSNDNGETRLTGRLTEDGAPCFSPNGRYLYFHQSENGKTRQLYRIDLKRMSDPPEKLDTGGDAMYCTVSPDGSKIAFVSYRSGPSGDIFMYDIKQKTLSQLTSGPAIDLFPGWGADKKTIYFSRIASDTNKDRKVSAEDNSIICRLDTSRQDAIPYPLTLLNYSSFMPFVSKQNLYFLSNIGGISNCWSLPIDGYIPSLKTPDKQLNFAETIANRIPYDHYSTLLSYYKLIDMPGSNNDLSAKAAYEVGNLYSQLEMAKSAESIYQFISRQYANSMPYSYLAKIKYTVLLFERGFSTSTLQQEKNKLMDDTLQELTKISEEHPGNISNEAFIEKANILLHYSEELSDLREAMTWLDNIISDPHAGNDQKAHALYIKGQILHKTSSPGQASRVFEQIIIFYPAENIWVDQAVETVLTIYLSDQISDDLTENVKQLQIIARDNKTKAPPLAMGALNRIGDLYFNNDNLDEAKSAYEYVIEEYPDLTTQTAAARLSLAEILFTEEQFRKAINLYETELGLRDSSDKIYQLARQGYIKKNIAAGEFQFQLGEIPSARSMFKELIDYDERIIEAHRGYIKCAYISGDIERILKYYNDKLVLSPRNPLWMYCTALSLTYINNLDSTQKARKLLEKAVRLDGSVEYYHQTLGYVYEVLETVYGKKRQLEVALESYQKAYFLNDRVSNPINTINLELNLGNIYYLLGQYGKAYKFYIKRLNKQINFSNKDTEILFYKRLGECAFQVEDISTTISSYKNAITLINENIDAIAASKAFDRLHNYVKNQILTPSISIDRYNNQKNEKETDSGLNSQKEKIKSLAHSISEKQSAISLKVSDLTQQAGQPPSSEWKNYKISMYNVLERQKKLNKKLLKLVKKLNAAIEDGLTVKPVINSKQNLSNFIRQIDEALTYPERLIELKAETLDRLGLAYQENEDWIPAVEAFETVFEINGKLQNNKNLAKNKRSAAYNKYQLSKNTTGQQQKKILKNALADFQDVITLVDKYGVSQSAQGRKEALVSLSLSTSLDEASATKAAKGFTAEQEKRLAETFISRIHLELGNLSLSRSEIEKQLKYYPLNAKVSKKDLYGVALLYHRAGLLSNAVRDYSQAIDQFAYSADLNLQMGNLVSTATNIQNLCTAFLNKMNLEEAWIDKDKQYLTLRDLDKRTSNSLSGDIRKTNLDLLATYHNTLGVFYVNLARKTKNDINASVIHISLMQHAVSHFSKGLAVFNQSEIRLTRKLIERKASLQLNMANAAIELGETETATLYFTSALKSAEAGVYNDIKWRALAGLGKIKEAYAALNAVSLLRAGCQPSEIINSFGSLVVLELNEKGPEAAFNTAEYISEIERFHWMAKFIQPVKYVDKNFYLKIYPRLKEINKLNDQLANIEGEKRTLLLKRLDKENELMSQIIGAGKEFLPEKLKNINDEELQQNALLLMGISVKAESIADLIAAENIKMSAFKDIDDRTSLEKINKLRARYKLLINKYQSICEDRYFSRDNNTSSDFLTLMAPEPAQAADLMKRLSGDETAVRIFYNGNTENTYTVFYVYPDDIEAFILPTLDQFEEKISTEIDWTVPYIAYENALKLNLNKAYPLALSGTHLFRCITNIKPFKNNLMTIPKVTLSPEINKLYRIDESQKIKGDFFEADIESLKDKISNINTLLIANGPHIELSIPTEPGDNVQQFFTVYIDDNSRFNLENLIVSMFGNTLSIFYNSSNENAYLSGHLFSIYGCPSILLINAKKNHQQLVNRFLEFYNQESGLTALNKIISPEPSDVEHLDQTETASPIFLLGHRGISPEESTKLAKKSFIRYIKTGRSEFDNGNYNKALALFESAVTVATEVKKYKRYLPDLYKYCRESAFRSGDLESSLIWAQNLTETLREKNVSSKPYAESMLRLGLIHSKLNNYEEAIPIIESSVQIFASLTVDKDLINAMVDLGIVLENATNYESALSKFQTAAELSSELDKQFLLGEQFSNIGRIYDLRINQYPAAIINYEKALQIFSAIEDVQKVSESMLNIGRCYRLLGNFIKADKYYHEGLEQINSIITPDSPDLKHLMVKIKILIEQSNNDWFQGRYESALLLQRQCLQLAKDHRFDHLQVISLNTAGLIWWTLGDYEKALNELNNALALAKKLTSRKDELASTFNNIGLVYREMRKYETALEMFDNAIQIDIELDSKWGTAYSYRNKGMTYLQMDQPENAVSYLEKAFQISNSIGNKINAAKAVLSRADAYYTLNNFKQAENDYLIALNLSNSMLIREIQWRALFGLANIQIDFYNNPEAAEKLLRESISVIEQLRSDIKLKQLKENFIADKLSVYETLVLLLANQNQPAQAFEIAERSRARNFIDLLGNHQIGFSDGAEEKLFNKQAAIKLEIEEQESLMVSSEDPQAKKSYQNSINELKHELQNVLLDIQLQNPQLASMTSVQPLNIDKLITKIEPEVGLLSYYLLDTEILCWVILSENKNKPDIDKLKLIRIKNNKSDFEKKVLEYRRIIQNLEPYEKHSMFLYDQLIKPVISELNDVKVLGIIPHGSIHYLSFATLFNGNNHLVDSFSLFYLPSASVLDYTLSKKSIREKGTSNVLAIGNPDLGDPLFDLPFSEHEVNSMKWNFPEVTILTGQKASENWVINNIPEFDIIHFASHGEFFPVNPLLSAIKLAAPRDNDFTKTDFDGNLEAGEIFGLEINADMVFLSACQTGLGKINAGDDVVGLNRSFFFAGTHTVISSLWRVSDVATAILIKSFYRNYMKKNKADSLTQAMLHVKANYAHPGYWGAFTLVGDYF